MMKSQHRHSREQPIVKFSLVSAAIACALTSSWLDAETVNRPMAVSKAGRLPAVLALSSLDGSNGFVVRGVRPGDWSGRSVAAAGDVNGDGIDDVIIGASRADPDGRLFAGESYVLFGNPNGFPASLELSSVDGANGFVIAGIESGDASGISVSAAGDFNGDGIDDVVIGAPLADGAGNTLAGQSYVVFGSRASFAARLELSALDGLNGFVINGAGYVDVSGGSVSAAGDINADGIDDIIIGAVYGNNNSGIESGAGYVVYGKRTRLRPSLDLSALDGDNGFAIMGNDYGDNLGRSVSAAGDINGDGIDDLIIGAFRADPNGTNAAGESYVVFGSSIPFSANLDPLLLDGKNGFVINGNAPRDYSGIHVSNVGDTNGDGIDDLIVGAPYATANGNSYAGESYVVFGRSKGFASSLGLSSINSTTGLIIKGAEVADFSGLSSSAAGDINGDGIDDLIIGAARADPGGRNYAGNSFVVFGSKLGYAGGLALSSLDGSNGFVVEGILENDRSGYSVSTAGDFNGDGIDDVIIGAAAASPGGRKEAGEVYLVFGSDGVFVDEFD